MELVQKVREAVEVGIFNSFEYGGVAISNPFYDETGRMPVEPEVYYGKKNLEQFILDPFLLSLPQIENYLRIKEVVKESLPQHYRTVICDDWKEVFYKLKDLRETDKDPSFSVSVYGYELVHDNHYIKLYYTQQPLFT